ncbi:putative solute carrier family 35 member F5-like protein [Operophtera brumata]|uniref:Putative solute carrier family 35 member F5-like protein n=1 Tax=Operophtera brumata TaxID=104452 RepID=A0A0L7LVP6_OPEBR|nr:putative solute carrier family 35 member F5-like protein [Operophtera brumata]
MRATSTSQQSGKSHITDDESYFKESTNSLGDSTFVPVRAGEATDSDDAAPRAVRFNKVAEVRVMSAAMAGEALLARLSWAASVRATEHAQRRAAAAATRRHLRLAMLFCLPVRVMSAAMAGEALLARLSWAASVRATEHAQRRAAAAATRRHLRVAMLFCLPWFISNYLYRLSLLHSSTGSATLYTSCAGALALSLGALFAQAPNDRFTASKGVAVLLTAAGLVS